MGPTESFTDSYLMAWKSESVSEVDVREYGSTIPDGSWWSAARFNLEAVLVIFLIDLEKKLLDRKGGSRREA